MDGVQAVVQIVHLTVKTAPVAQDARVPARQHAHQVQEVQELKQKSRSYFPDGDL